ncbi:MAG: hypothetical protein NW226_10315 [Microscillaceae bacterium]|nr:hypothetical protein [Microscillaceae bacterium]
MKNKPDPLDNKFRERFSDFQAEPDEALLAKIQARLNPYTHRTQTIFGPSVWLVSSTLVFLALWGDGLMPLPSHTNEFPDKTITELEAYQNHQPQKPTNHQNHHTEIIPRSRKDTAFFSSDYTPTLPDTIKIASRENAPIPENQPFYISIIPGIEFSPAKNPETILKLTKINTHALSPQPGENKAPRLFISLKPQMNYYHIRPDKKDDILVRDIDAGKFLSAQRLGWSIQMGGYLALNDRFSLRVGASYTQWKQTWQYTFNAVNSGEIGTLFTQNKTIHAAGLAADVLYAFRPGKRHTSYWVSGLQVSFPVGAPALQTQIIGQLGYNWSYPIQKNVIFWAEPTLGIHLNRIQNETEPVKIRPYTLGLHLGLSLKLGK